MNSDADVYLPYVLKYAKQIPVGYSEIDNVGMQTITMKRCESYFNTTRRLRCV